MKPSIFFVAALFGLLLVGGSGVGIDLSTPLASASDRAAARAAAAKEPSAYDAKVEPLKPEECGKCHPAIFNFLSTEGARHKKNLCTTCHREFHMYSPRKQNFEAIMPKCNWCHKSQSGGPFHGDNEAITTCLNCHENPHKPLAIAVANIEAKCQYCHTKQRKELDDFPSKHATEVKCVDCHSDRHGNIPECFKCHENHSPAVPMKFQDCLACHSVHKPLIISFTEKTDSKICAGCHSGPYSLLQEKITKHTAVGCPRCHTEHGKIPQCTKCHGIPHSQKMLQDMTKCGDCHGKAHSLNTD